MATTDERELIRLRGKIRAAGNRAEWLGGRLTVSCLVVFPILWLYHVGTQVGFGGEALTTAGYWLFAVVATPAVALFFSGYLIPKLVVGIYRGLEEVRFWLTISTLPHAQRDAVLMPLWRELPEHHRYVPCQGRLIVEWLMRSTRVYPPGRSTLS